MNVMEAKGQRKMNAADGDTWNVASVARSSEAEIGHSSGESGFDTNRKDLLEETRRSVGQSWDCSQKENDVEERDAGSRTMKKKR